MTVTNTVAIGLLLILLALTIAIFVSGALILLASRWLLGRSGMLGSAAMAVVTSAVVNGALQFGLLLLTAKAPALADYALALQGAQVVLGVLLTCVIYMLMLDPKPSFVQAFLILLIQAVIGGAILGGCAFLIIGVLHVTPPPLPTMP